MKTTKALLGALVLFAAASALEAQETPWFVGLKIGNTWFAKDVRGYDNAKFARMKDSGGPVGTVEFGREFGRHFALTGSLSEYGSGFCARNEFLPGIYDTIDEPFGHNGPFRLSVRGASVSATGFLPINDKLRLYAKVGTLFWKMRLRWETPSWSLLSVGTVSADPAPIGIPISGNVYYVTENSSGQDLFLAGGAEYSFTKRWSVRLEYEQAWTRLGTLQGGVYWHF